MALSMSLSMSDEHGTPSAEASRACVDRLCCSRCVSVISALQSGGVVRESSRRGDESRMGF
eukprot:2667720-Prymnesium_polylepis.2